MTQLVESATTLHPEESSVGVALTVRTEHLRLLLDLLRQGGCGVLVTELVSTDTFSELDQLLARQLGAAALTLIANRNFFTGTNPFVLAHLMASDPCVAEVRLTGPWRWRLGSQRSYLAYGLMFWKVPLTVSGWASLEADEPGPRVAFDNGFASGGSRRD
jgi:hypothetical protein